MNIEKTNKWEICVFKTEKQKTVFRELGMWAEECLLLQLWLLSFSFAEDFD